MILYLLRLWRRRRTEVSQPTGHPFRFPLVEKLKKRVVDRLTRFDQRLSFRQRKHALLAFCIVSTLFFSYVFYRGITMRPMRGRSLLPSHMTPMPPIVTDTQTLHSLWDTIRSHSDSFTDQPQHHDTTKK